MNNADRLNKFEAQIAATQRQLKGFLSVAANPTAGPPVRLAQITTVVDSEPETEVDDEEPIVSVFGIKFVDASFNEELATEQNPDVTLRAETEYHAAAIGQISPAQGDLVIVSRNNGRWWILSIALGPLRLVAGEADTEAYDLPAYFFNGAGPSPHPTGTTFFDIGEESPVLAQIPKGVVLPGISYWLLGYDAASDLGPYEFSWIVLNPTLTLVGKTNETIAQGTGGNIQLYSNGTDLEYSFDATNRLQTSVEEDKWVLCHFTDVKPADVSDGAEFWNLIGEIEGSGSGNPVVLAEGTEFKLHGNVAAFTILEPDTDKGTETATGGSLNAYVRRGLVLNEHRYQLTRVCPGDDAEYEVDNPELAVTGTASADYALGATGTFSVAGNSVNALVILGPVSNGESYRLVWVVNLWVALGIPDEAAHPNLEAVADEDILYGTSGSFTTSDGTKTGLVTRGLVLDGETYTLTWVEDHYEVLDPELAVTGNCDLFFQFGDPAEDFSVGTLTVPASLSRGLCLAEKEYGLIWADGDHFAVIDPELLVTGTADGYTLASNSGDFTVAGNTVAADVTRGMVFDGKSYLLVWNDDEWECANPTTSISGKTDSTHNKSASGTISVYAGTLGAETDTGENVTAYNRYANLASTKWVELEWKDGSAGWVIVSGEC